MHSLIIARIDLMRSLRHVRTGSKKSSPPKNPELAGNQIARINELSKIARTSWFGLLAYLAFAGVTLLGVEDADFFIDSRQTELPLIGVQIPTRDFFLFGPILGTALFVYLHLYLLKLWDALAAAPPRPNGEALSLQVTPWLINDLGLWLRRDNAYQRRPMAWLSHTVTFFLVFAIGPIVIGYFWVRYWPVHELVHSIFSALLFTLTCMTMLSSLFTAVTRLRYGRADHRGPADILVAISTALIVLVTMPLTVAKTHGPETLGLSELSLERMYDQGVFESPVGNLLDWRLAPLDFKDIRLSDVPDGWLSCEFAKRDARADYAKREGLDYSSEWTPKHLASFEAEWLRRRDAEISSVKQQDFRDADLRNADFAGAFGVGLRLPSLPWVGANLSPNIFEGTQHFDMRTCRLKLAGLYLNESNFRNARMNGADFESVVLERADLSNASLVGANLAHSFFDMADLSGTQLEGADLRNTFLTDAYMKGANLDDANLNGSALLNADLTEATLNNALLNNASLHGTNLFKAKMQGASLARTSLNGTVLIQTDLRSTQWEGPVGSAVAQAADFRGSPSLSQDRLLEMVGNEYTLLPVNEGDSGEALYIPSCWTSEPGGWDLIKEVSKRNGLDESAVRSQFICAAGTLPRKTGTPWPLDKSPPWETDPDWQPEDRGPVLDKREAERTVPGMAPPKAGSQPEIRPIIIPTQPD